MPRSRRDFAALDADLAVVAAYGLILPAADPRGAESRLHQRPRLAPAPLARRGADPARDPRRRRGHRRDDHANGRRAGHRADAASRRRSIFAARMPAKSRRNWRNSARRRWSTGSASPTPPEPQPIAGATYAAKIDKAEARIDWTRPAAGDRAAGARLRALRPAHGSKRTASGSSCSMQSWPRASGKRRARCSTTSLTIAAGNGAIRPLMVQRAGRARR